MGIFRKTSSMLTLGAVDFRSDKERTARYTRQTRNAVRAQSRMQSQLAQIPPAPQPAAAAPGWYPAPGDAPSVVRWFDGYTWTATWRYR